MLKSFFVSDQLYCHILLSFVVEAFDSLTETSFAKKFNDFKSVCDMVLNYYLVVSSLIVIAKVIGMKRRTLDLTLECSHVLSVNLVGQGPEGTLPNHAGLGVLEAQEVLVVNTGGRHAEVEI